MKKINYLLSLASAFLLAACSTEVEEFTISDNSNGESLEVSVSMPEDDTRVNTGDLLNMSWEEGDVIYAIGVGFDYRLGEDQVLGVSALTLSKANGKTATFKGDKVADAERYYFCYTNKCTQDDLEYKFSPYGSLGNIYYDNQQQPRINSSAHIKNEIVLLSSSIDANSTPTYPIILKQKNNILRINVKEMPKALKEATSCKVTVVYGTTDAVTTLGSQMTDGDNYLYLAFEEAELKIGEGVRAIFDVNGTKYIAKGISTKHLSSYGDPGRIYTMDIANTSTDAHRALVWEEDYDKPANDRM